MGDFAYQWPYANITQPRDTRTEGLNVFSTLSAQIATLSERLDVLAAQHTRELAVTCEYCAGEHPSYQCNIRVGQVQFGGDYLNNNVYPNDHQGWGYHPDYEWSYNYQDQYCISSPTYPSDFSNPPQMQQEENSELKEFMSKIIADREEMIMSQELSTQNLNSQMEQLINSSMNGPQYMDFETENNSILEELWFKFIASTEEKMIEQEKSIRNLQNQLDQMFEALNNRPQNNWCYVMNDEIDGEPEVYMPLDELKEVVIEETTRELDSVEHELTCIVPQMPFQSELKNSVNFAHPCPLGSHIQSKDQDDKEASYKPWWAEEEKREEEKVVVFFMPQCKNLFTDTTGEAPGVAMELGTLCTGNMLGGFNPKTLMMGNLPKHIAVLMDGGFLAYRRGIG